MNLLDYSATAVPIGRLQSGVSWGVTLFADSFRDISLLSHAGALQRKLNQPLGATEHQLPPESSVSGRPRPGDRVEVVVCGAHLEGQPLNWQLKDRGAVFKLKTRTRPGYALYALPDGKRPALVQQEDGAAIEVEVWEMPMAQLGSFVAGIPEPLGIGKVTLESGDCVPGFICEQGGIEGARDISHYGGWRAWLADK